MAITTRDELIAALAAAERKSIIKASATAEGAGTFHSLWKVAGNPKAGASPPLLSAGSGYIPTRATVGALGQVDGDTDLLRVLKASLGGPTQGTVTLYDRVWACSGFGTVVVTEQSITTPGTLTTGRDPNNGADVEPWLEVYTAPGATTATWTFKGTDALGNANRTWTYTHPANAETVGQMMPLFPGGASPASAHGCRVPTSFQASANSGTAGDVGITLLRKIVDIPITIPGVQTVLDAIATALTGIPDDACLAMRVLCTTTSTGIIQGEFAFND